MRDGIIQMRYEKNTSVYVEEMPDPQITGTLQKRDKLTNKQRHPFN